MSDTVLRSALLTQHGFRHGFSLRAGGVSAAPYDTLNLGRAVGDDPEAVEANHARLAEAVGYRVESLYEVSQVHGADVHVVDDGARVADVRTVTADALVVRGEGRAVAVRVADCAPVLIADTRTRAVAAAHAGWRGTVAGVVPATIAKLVEHAGSRVEDLVVAIGPHIRVEAFEVGEDVAATIAAAAHGADVVRRDRRWPKPHVDLAAVLRAQLAAIGVGPERVDDAGGCTQTEPERFFSFRRDGKRSGRHVGVIVAG